MNKPNFEVLLLFIQRIKPEKITIYGSLSRDFNECITGICDNYQITKTVVDNFANLAETDLIILGRDEFCDLELKKLLQGEDVPMILLLNGEIGRGSLDFEKYHCVSLDEKDESTFIVRQEKLKDMLYLKIELLEDALKSVRKQTQHLLSERNSDMLTSQSKIKIYSLAFIYSLLFLFNKSFRNVLTNLKACVSLFFNDLFDYEYYCKTNPDISSFKWGPLAHYIYYGGFEGRNPNSSFDSIHYLYLNPDVKKKKLNPFVHYVVFGMKEGRQADTVVELEEETKVYFYKGNSKVSIIMPTWNRAAVIDKAIQSVISQTYKHYELIIIDDGSQDNTEVLIHTKYKVQLENGQIRYIKQNNQGVSAARNKALSIADGQYIAYLDSDNAWRPDFLSCILGVIEVRGCLAAYASLSVHDNINKREFIRKQPYDRKRLLAGNYIDLNIFVHHRILYEQMGGFNESLKRFVDWDFILRLTKKNPPCFVNKVLADYYLAEDLNNITHTVSMDVYKNKVLELHREEILYGE